MTQPKAADPEFAIQQKLPRRDRILLPLIALLTICLFGGALEFLALRLFPISMQVGEDCMRLDDPLTGIRGTPNSTCWEKPSEGELMEYHFNSSGYRSNVNFGPKTKGTYRIVMVGTSFATGLRVAEKGTFADLLPEELSQLTGRKVELYNEAIVRRLPDVIANHFNEVLKFQPDMILWIVTRADIQSSALDPPLSKLEPRARNPLERIWLNLRHDFESQSFAAAIAKTVDGSRIAFLLRHYLYKSQSQYVKSYLIAADTEMGYLKTSPSVEWQNRLLQFDAAANSISAQAKAAGVPVVAVFLPRGPQAAMISLGEWPAGYDPYKIDDEVRAIIERHGETYIDILPGFRTISNPERGFFRVEGHPNVTGHAIISDLLAKQLTNGAVPALKTTNSSMVQAR